MEPGRKDVRVPNNSRWNKRSLLDLMLNEVTLERQVLSLEGTFRSYDFFFFFNIEGLFWAWVPGKSYLQDVTWNQRIHCP